MSEQTAPERIAVVWSPEARVELRAIDRKTALEILHCIDHYLATRTADVKKLKPPLTGFRLVVAIIASSLMPRTKRPSISTP